MNPITPRIGRSHFDLRAAIFLHLLMGLFVSVRADWPQASGPHGNFTPQRHGHTIVDGLHNVKQVWASEYDDLGFAKGSASGYIANLAKWSGHPGSCSGPIVADGKVFANSFRPCGDVWADRMPHVEHDKSKNFTPEQRKQMARNLRIDADDLTVAIDAKTGKTLWEAVEPGKGVNLYMGKREGFGVTPAYYNGRVFAMGTSGRLYAYDADTGEKLWETNIGKAHQRMEAEKKKALSEHKLAKNFGWDASLVVADGVLILPLYDSNVDITMRGVDPTDGAALWELPGVNSRYATPAIYHYDGRQYVVMANRKGEMRLVDPRDGKVLWTVTGLAPNWGSLTVAGSYVFVDVNSKGIEDGKEIPFALIAAYRLSPDGAEHQWSLPDNKKFWFGNHMDSVARRRTTVGDGLLYFTSGNKAGGAKNYTFSILRVRDGKVLLKRDDLHGKPALMYRVEDRLLYIADPAHKDRLKIQMFTADAGDFRELGTQWKPPQITTTAYEVSMELPIVDNRLYMRTREGRITCYDLRQGNAK